MPGTLADHVPFRPPHLPPSRPWMARWLELVICLMPGRLRCCFQDVFSKGDPSSPIYVCRQNVPSILPTPRRRSSVMQPVPKSHPRRFSIRPETLSNQRTQKETFQPLYFLQAILQATLLLTASPAGRERKKKRYSPPPPPACQRVYPAPNPNRGDRPLLSPETASVTCTSTARVSTSHDATPAFSSTHIHSVQYVAKPFPLAVYVHPQSSSTGVRFPEPPQRYQGVARELFMAHGGFKHYGVVPAAFDVWVRRGSAGEGGTRTKWVATVRLKRQHCPSCQRRPRLPGHSESCIYLPSPAAAGWFCYIGVGRHQTSATVS
ncbi:hypothetical protein LZ30DRAFT_197988 [Colletotrichum cereale]|nr:hypothetical protein LZ30DRAFT_197988 [Colletotrichum cereale]